MTDNWTPNRRAYQPKRKGNTDHIVHLINLLCELVDCPEASSARRCASARSACSTSITATSVISGRGPRSARLTAP
jgi:hypothetical protein